MSSPTNVPSPSNRADCIFSGNADFYGFGIRLGTYFQFVATLLVTIFAPGEEEFYRALNNILQTAMFAGLILLTRSGDLVSIEPVLVIFLLFGSLSSLTSEGFSPLGKLSGLYRLLLYSGIAGYSCWFWFVGLDTTVKPLAPAHCNLKETAFFGQVSPRGRFRTFNKAASVMGLVVCILYLIWGAKKWLPTGRPGNLNTGRSTDVVLLAYSLTVILISIVGAEYIVRANHVQGVYDVNAVGQIVPLLVGALGLIETLKDVLLGVVGSGPPRRWTYLGKPKEHWAEAWAMIFSKGRTVPVLNHSATIPAVSCWKEESPMDDDSTASPK
jgi:hypothetical protein